MNEIVKNENNEVQTTQILTQKVSEVDPNVVIERTADVVNNVLNLSSNILDFSKAVVEANMQIEIANKQLEEAFINAKSRSESMLYKSEELIRLHDKLDKTIDGIFNLISKHEIGEEGYRLLNNLLATADKLVDKMPSL